MAMETRTLLVEHYLLLIKNIAYLTAHGIQYLERMEPLLLRAIDHLHVAHVADAPTCKALLTLAIEDELCHVHSQHPQYAHSLRMALQSLGR
ncbi:hypothetical protein J8I26_17145 [Herbaspirillum sp. LeCh32-8]|uniref:hypothetical protein n=1 Tax=Herbaspirillum sp. LeCh32-8 TaxID=2821356 RepID=UPI001AE45DAE|nr:hypothetical protein [Herbaspirillum sp. LeCh32-8]MBP0599840.1 hypothetical protein [Herbaspirillum sp. LeCh32-8]